MSDKLKILKKELEGGDIGALGKIRTTVLGLVEPPQLVRLICSLPLLFDYLDILATLVLLL